MSAISDELLMEQDLSVPVIAIDGGAASGKGAARHFVAVDLGFDELDSGLLYRALGLKAHETGRWDTDHLVELALTLQLRMDGERVYLDGVERSARIRSEDISDFAKAVAKIPEVRAALLRFQLDKRKMPGLVADGRDMGDIFETPYRFFLTARADVRAERRVNQLKGLNQEADYFEIYEKILRRDEEDSMRATAPLRPHPKAITIDTSDISAREVAAQILRRYRMSL